MNYQDYNDYELLYLIEKQDDDAFQILREKYRPICIYLCKEYYQEKEEIIVSYQDYLSNCEIALTRAIKSFDERKNVTFYTYFLICLTSSIKGLKRRVYQKKNNFLLEHSSYNYEIEDYYQEKYSSYEIRDEDPAMLINTLELENSIKEYFFSLEPFSSRILELKMNGFKYKEIANLLNTTQEKVTKEIRKNREYLKNLLKRQKKN